MIATAISYRTGYVGQVAAICALIVAPLILMIITRAVEQVRRTSRAVQQLSETLNSLAIHQIILDEPQIFSAGSLGEADCPAPYDWEADL